MGGGAYCSLEVPLRKTGQEAAEVGEYVFIEHHSSEVGKQDTGRLRERKRRS